jgi:hypothetical protein
MTDIVRTTIDQYISQVTKASSTPSPPLGYGVDLVCVTDLTARLDETDPNSLESLAQDSFHRITTARLSLIDDPNYGIDIRAALSVGQTPQQIQSWSGQLSSELKKDDRVALADVTIVFSAPADYLITIVITPEDPSITAFTLVVAVTNGEALLEAINSAPK